MKLKKIQLATKNVEQPKRKMQGQGRKKEKGGEQQQQPRRLLKHIPLRSFLEERRPVAHKESWDSKGFHFLLPQRVSHTHQGNKPPGVVAASQAD